MKVSIALLSLGIWILRSLNEGEDLHVDNITCEAAYLLMACLVDG